MFYTPTIGGETSGKVLPAGRGAPMAAYPSGMPRDRRSSPTGPLRLRVENIKCFLILPRCFAQDLLKIRNEMLLAAVAKVIGNRCPIRLLGFADLLGRRQKSVSLQQPFESDANVVLK